MALVLPFEAFVSYCLVGALQVVVLFDQLSAFFFQLSSDSVVLLAFKQVLLLYFLLLLLSQLQLSFDPCADLLVLIQFTCLLADLQSQLVDFAFVLLLLGKVLIFVALIELLGLLELCEEGVDIFVLHIDCAPEVVFLIVGQRRQYRRCECFVSHKTK